MFKCYKIGTLLYQCICYFSDVLNLFRQTNLRPFYHPPLPHLPLLSHLTGAYSKIQSNDRINFDHYKHMYTIMRIFLTPFLLKDVINFFRNERLHVQAHTSWSIWQMKDMKENSEIINMSHSIFADLSVFFLHLFDKLGSVKWL